MSFDAVAFFMSLGAPSLIVFFATAAFVAYIGLPPGLRLLLKSRKISQSAVDRLKWAVVFACFGLCVALVFNASPSASVKANEQKPQVDPQPEPQPQLQPEPPLSCLGRACIDSAEPSGHLVEVAGSAEEHRSGYAHIFKRPHGTTNAFTHAGVVAPTGAAQFRHTVPVRGPLEPPGQFQLLACILSTHKAPPTLSFEALQNGGACPAKVVRIKPPSVEITHTTRHRGALIVAGRSTGLRRDETCWLRVENPGVCSHELIETAAESWQVTFRENLPAGALKLLPICRETEPACDSTEGSIGPIIRCSERGSCRPLLAVNP